jgi:hypothetical protein
MKDNFSTQSDQYARYRPTYPAELFQYLDTLLPNKQTAWDCGTGNGQVAYELAKTFQSVFATDISRQQLANAMQADNITYAVQPAESTNFREEQFDLITVAQAIHWFQFEPFYAEVKRTAKKGALLCVIGYGKLKISEPIDNVIENFYENIIGPYWDAERKYIDEDYKTIPFPFEEIEAPNFVNKLHWSLQHLLGYLNTWSAVKHFINKNGYNPVYALQKELAPIWGGEEVRTIEFPLLLRIGQIT